MYAFVTILIAIICLLIIAVVLVQNPKGGGLGAGFGGGGGGGAASGGVQSTADFLERATWGLAIALLALSIFSNALIDKGNVNTIDTSSDDIEIFNPLD